MAESYHSAPIPKLADDLARAARDHSLEAAGRTGEMHPRPERRGVSRTSVIEAAKAAVPTVDLADRLCGPCQLRRVGQRWVARCPLPNHEDRSPSFVVYIETNSWFCYGCQRGGDVVDLAAAAWSIPRADVAAAEVLMAFGHEVPQRPPSWFDRQQRQAPMRAKIEDVRTQVMMRRLFKIVFMPMLAGIEDADERAAMAADLWRDVLPMAARMVEDSRGNG